MSEEMLDVVDEEDKVIRQEPRSVVRKNTLLHRSAQIIVQNEKGKYFVHKRATTKDIWPGMYGICVGETVKAGESYDSAAKRGVQEEIGIYTQPDFLFYDKFRSKENNSNFKVYKCVVAGELDFTDDEISEGFFVTKEELEKMLREKEFVPDDIQIIEKYWKMKNG